MIGTNNMLNQAKIYASRFDDDQDQGIAGASFLDGYKAGYDQTYREWHEYRQWMKQQWEKINWYRALVAFGLGLLIGTWK